MSRSSMSLQPSHLATSGSNLILNDAWTSDHRPRVILMGPYSAADGSMWPAGSIFSVNSLNELSDIKNIAEVEVQSADKPQHPTIMIPGINLEMLDSVTSDLLICIKTPQKRMTVYTDPVRLNEVKALNIGEPVLLSDMANLDQDTPGYLKYKGPVSGIPGTYFGIQLDPEYEGKGTSNGTFRKVVYFKCKEDCAVFVSCYCVRSNKDLDQFTSTSSSSMSGDKRSTQSFDNFDLSLSENVPFSTNPSTQGAVPMYQSAAISTEQGPAFSQSEGRRNPPSGQNVITNVYQPESAEITPARPEQQMMQSPMRALSDPDTLTPTQSLNGLLGPSDHLLKVGDRVVWVTEQDFHRGVVRWLGGPGELDPTEQKPTAGVEFDEPVGSGTGRYKGRQVFTAKRNHASLMPVIGLIKEEDFFGESSTPTPPPHRGEDEGEDDPDFAAAIAASLAESRQQGTEGNSSDFARNIRMPPDGVTDLFSGVVRPKEIPVKPQNQATSYQQGGTAKIAQRNLPSTMQKSLPIGSARPSPSVHNISDFSTTSVESNQASSINTRIASMDNASARSLPSEEKEEFTIGSKVEVLKNPVRYGKIAWMGYLDNAPDKTKKIAGILMDDEDKLCYTDGSFRGKRVFQAPPHRVLFIFLHLVKKDQRQRKNAPSAVPALGNLLTGSISGAASGQPIPVNVSQRQQTLNLALAMVPKISDRSLLKKYIGKARGIQGFEGGSALISLLYIFFQFSDCLDHWISVTADTANVDTNVKQILIKVASQLRTIGYTDSKMIEELLKIMKEYSETHRLKPISRSYPEDYVSILSNILHISPLMDDSQNFCLQIKASNNNLVSQLQFPTLQEVVETHIVENNVKFTSIPEILLIQLSYFDGVFPSLELDLQEMAVGFKKYCYICGEAATVQCHKCFDVHKDLTSATFFCSACCSTKHQNKKYQHHKPCLISIPEDGNQPKSSKINLFAILSHLDTKYISFVKCQTGEESTWLRFDCLKEKVLIGESHTSTRYIPEVKEVKQICSWLSKSQKAHIRSMPKLNMPSDMQQIMHGSYMCFYKVNP